MNPPDILSKITSAVERRLSLRQAKIPYDVLNQGLSSARAPQSFVKQLKDGIKVIAEIKFRSPSQSSQTLGAPRASTVENAIEIAGKYLAGGASALSVLTEEDHFDGRLEYLSAIRNCYPESHLLMKDFMIDEYQLVEARILGADCVLLIVALLGEDKLRTLYLRALELGLSVLVEVHDEEEMKTAVRLKASLIGINNRNLKTLKISMDTSRRLVSLAPTGTVLVCESGIEGATEILEMGRLGFSGFLIGTSFMRTDNPGRSLEKLLHDARGARS